MLPVLNNIILAVFLPDVSYVTIQPYGQGRIQELQLGGASVPSLHLPSSSSPPLPFPSPPPPFSSLFFPFPPLPSPPLEVGPLKSS